MQRRMIEIEQLLHAQVMVFSDFGMWVGDLHEISEAEAEMQMFEVETVAGTVQFLQAEIDKFDFICGKWEIHLVSYRERHMTVLQRMDEVRKDRDRFYTAGQSLRDTVKKLGRQIEAGQCEMASLRDFSADLETERDAFQADYEAADARGLKSDLEVVDLHMELANCMNLLNLAERNELEALRRLKAAKDAMDDAGLDTLWLTDSCRD